MSQEISDLALSLQGRLENTLKELRRSQKEQEEQRDELIQDLDEIQAQIEVFEMTITQISGLIQVNK